MIFDGMKFRRSSTIEYYYPEQGPFVFFRAIKTGRAIPLSGHSLTNMAYAEDGRVLLVKDGMVYTSPKKRVNKYS